MITSILLTTDGSETSKRAIQHAIVLAKKFEAKISVVSVVNYSQMSPYSMAASFDGPNIESLTTAVQENLNFAQQIITDAQVPCDVYLEKGDPRIVIADKMVASLKPDLLVMGKTGTNKISRIFLGSTARYVSENAQTNVLLVE